MVRQFALLLSLAAVALIASCKPPTAATPSTLVVRGGPLLEDVFAEIASRFAAEHPEVDLRADFTCPPCKLTTRVEEGIDLDVFISAGEVELAILGGSGIVDRSTTEHLGRAELVLAVPPDNPADVTSLGDVHRDSIKRISIGDPIKTSPGHYAKQAFTAMGLWGEIQPKLNFTETGCKARQEAVLGYADAALLYNFCLHDEAGTPEVIETVDPSLHDPIYISISTAPGRWSDAAEAFVDFMFSTETTALLRSYGIKPLDSPKDDS